MKSFRTYIKGEWYYNPMMEDNNTRHRVSKIPKWVRIDKVEHNENAGGDYRSFTFDAFITPDGEFVKTQKTQSNNEFEEAMVLVPLYNLLSVFPSLEAQMTGNLLTIKDNYDII